MSIIYLHGFQSSAGSQKGTALDDFLQRHSKGYLAELPTLPPRPSNAMAWMQERMREKPEVRGIIGSSLGGCYAHWMACEYDLKAVLVNPATGAHRIMREYLGPNRNPSTGESFTLDEDDMRALEQMDEAPITRPENLLCLLQKGDDVLDWSVAAERYAGCRLQVSEGGSHAFEGWVETLPLVLEHLGISSA